MTQQACPSCGWPIREPSMLDERSMSHRCVKDIASGMVTFQSSTIPTVWGEYIVSQSNARYALSPVRR